MSSTALLILMSTLSVGHSMKADAGVPDFGRCPKITGGDLLPFPRSPTTTDGPATAQQVVLADRVADDADAGIEDVPSAALLALGNSYAARGKDALAAKSYLAFHVRNPGSEFGLDALEGQAWVSMRSGSKKQTLSVLKAMAPGVASASVARREQSELFVAALVEAMAEPLVCFHCLNQDEASDYLAEYLKLFPDGIYARAFTFYSHEYRDLDAEGAKAVSELIAAERATGNPEQSWVKIAEAKVAHFETLKAKSQAHEVRKLSVR